MPLTCIYLRQLNLYKMQRTKMGLNSRQYAYTESKEDQREGFVLFFLRLLRKYVGKK